MSDPGLHIAVSPLAVATAYLPLALALGAAVGAGIVVLARRSRRDTPADEPTEPDVATALAAATDPAALARLFVEAVERAFSADATCLMLVSDDGREARGLAGRADGRDRPRAGAVGSRGRRRRRGAVDRL